MAAKVELGGQVSGLQLLTLTGDASYPAGGYPVTVGPNGIVVQAGGSSVGYRGIWDPVTRKMRVIDDLTGQTDVSAGTDLTGVQLRFLIA